MDWVFFVVTAATPLALAASGELVCERSGVLNLGVEGMMIVGAVAAFATEVATGSAPLGIVAGAAAGMLVALLFAVLVLWLRTDQVPTGLALTLFGLGLSALIGSAYIGVSLPAAEKGIPLLRDLPLVGELLFGHDLMAYLTVAIVAFTWWLLQRTKAGLVIRAVGEDHDAAHALGYPVLLVRLGCVLYGGLLAGMGGAYLSLIYTPLWAEDMTAGRGWIALALVVFATWRPWWVLAGAYLFGGFTILQFYLQGLGLGISSQYTSMLPYLATIVVLVWSSSRPNRYLGAPACLGRPFAAG